MKNIIVLYGGKSVEHDISVITALQAMANMPNGYKFYPIYILPSGEFVTGENLTQPENYLNFTKKSKKTYRICFNLGKNEIFIIKNKKIKNTIKVDFALLCNHGHGGEDGSLQGLLELCDIPYSSSSIVASALTMDKTLTKKILMCEHIDTPAYVQFYNKEYKFDEQKILQKIIDKLSFPCIVKPASLGSSVGVNICSDEEMLKQAIDYALNFDNKIIVEKFVENAEEYCCAALKFSEDVFVSKVVGVHNGDFYTFEDKYLSDQREEPGLVDQKLQNKIKYLTKKVYNVFDLNGIVRIDFLFDKKRNKLYVNEPNSIPGSLSFNLFNEKFSTLIDMIIENGIKEHKLKKDITYTFSSDAIKNFINMSKSKKLTK